MSISIMTQCWPVQCRQTLKLLLLALADNADDDGVCWPSIDNIAAKCSTDRRTIFRQLLELEALGHIAREQRRGHSNIFHVHPIPVTSTPPVANMPPVAPVSHPPVVTESPTRGATVTQNHQEPSFESSKKQKARNAPVDTVELPDWLPTEHWTSFLAMRVKLRKPATARAQRMLLSKLGDMVEHGHSAAQILAQSELKCWTDIYEPKDR